MFKLSQLPPRIREAFDTPAIFWPSAVTVAIEEGLTNLDDLTNLVFFMHHKERIDNDVGRALNSSEADFKQLANEWNGFQTILKPILKDLLEQSIDPENPSGSSSWTLTPKERLDLLSAGGKALLDWAQIPPDDTETREFLPAQEHKTTFKTIFAWKSLNPERTCVADPGHKVQIVMMLRDDIAFWQEHTPNMTQAEIKKVAQESSIRAYRFRIVEQGQCPRSAQQAEIALGNALLLMMAKGLIGMIPVPGLKGSPQLKSLGDFINAMSNLLASLGDTARN